MCPRTDMRQCCCRSRQTDNITLSPMAAEPSCPMRRIITWQSLSSWHWSGWLQNISGSTCPRKTNNNPLTYIMTTPNLDATSHQWVGALAHFNFELEYQKGHDNTVADVLSWVSIQLDPDMVRSILDRVAMGLVHQAKVHDLTIVEGGRCLKQEVCVAADCMLVQMHVTDWTEAQTEDLMLSTVLY